MFKSQTSSCILQAVDVAQLVLYLPSMHKVLICF